MWKRLTIWVNVCYNLLFLRDILEGHLSLEDADNKQSYFASELKNFNKGIKTIEKSSFIFQCKRNSS